METKVKQKRTLSHWMYWIILTIAVLVFCFSAYQLLSYRVEEDKEIAVNERVHEIAKTESEAKLDFTALKAANKDTVGWILIPDTKIDYPLVKGNDNDYYLNHNFEKKLNKAGTVFLDYRQSFVNPAPNLFLYGHNMHNGTMFADIEKFLNKAFFDAHPYIYIFTEDIVYRGEILALTQQLNNEMTGLEYRRHSSEFYEFVLDLQQNNKQGSNIEFKQEDSLITLYTCSYENGQGAYTDLRYLLHAKLVVWDGTYNTAKKQ